MRNILVLSVFILFLLACSDSDKKSSEGIIKSFTVNSVKGIVSEEDKTVTVTLPDGSSVSKLRPVIKLSAGASIKPKSEDLQDFTNPVRYTVTAEDGSVSVYNAHVGVALNTYVENVWDKELQAGENMFIAGKFAHSGNKVMLEGAENTYEMQIISENLNRIEIRVPEEVALGAYDLSVISGEWKTVFSEKITVIRNFSVERVHPLSVGASDTIEILVEDFANSGSEVLFEGTDYKLDVISEKDGRITAVIPKAPFGEYTLHVQNGYNKGNYAHKVFIVNPDSLHLKGVEKINIVRGEEPLIVYGSGFWEEFSPHRSLMVYLKKTDDPASEDKSFIVSMKNDFDFKFSLSVLWLLSLDIGEYSLFVVKNAHNGLNGIGARNKEVSNTILFNLLPNPGPVPEVHSISAQTVCEKEYVTLTGANFKGETLVKLRNNNELSVTATIVSQSPTEIVFYVWKSPLDKDCRFNEIEVRSNGNSTSYYTDFHVKMCD